MVMVCKKCSGNRAGDLRKQLKKALRRHGVHQRVKLVRVGCLDVCPKARVTTVLAPARGPGGCFVIDPEKDLEALVEEIAGWAAPI